MNIEEAIKEVENYLDYEGYITISAIATLYTAYEKEKEERKRIGKLYYEANENCIKYEKVIKQIVDYVNIDDETMEQLSIFDVNGIEIMKIIKENLK